MKTARPILLPAALAVLFGVTAAFAQTTQPAAAMPTTCPATTAPATQSAEETAIKAELTKYNAAVTAGDVPLLQSFISVSTPGQQKALAFIGKVTTSGRGMYSAVVEKFGEEGMAKDNVDRTSFPAGFPPMPVDDVAILVNLPKATLVSKAAADGVQPLALTKKDGSWKIDGDALFPVMTDKQLTEQSGLVEAAIGAIDQTAADTRAGSFRAADEAVMVLNLRVKKAVQAVQMKMVPIADPSMMGPAEGPNPHVNPHKPLGPTTAPAGDPQMP